jgi:hypothetical protein
LPRLGLDALTHGPLSGNPIPANVFMPVGGISLGITVAAFVAVKVRVFPEALSYVPIGVTISRASRPCISPPFLNPKNPTKTSSLPVVPALQ